MKLFRRTQKCKCLYEEGSTEPWYICGLHGISKLVPAIRAEESIQEGRDTSMSFWLYSLRLENGKYYVGITTKKNPQDRINAHGGFYGARWTMKYKPVETLEIHNLGQMTLEKAQQLEQNVTMDYMKKYGYKNVRGGLLTYTGRYIRIGNHFWREQDFENLLAGLLIIVLTTYIFLTR